MNSSMESWRKNIAVLLVVMFPLFVGFPGALALDPAGGTLLGVITTDGGGDVLPGAVVQVRNTVTGEMITSGPADELGMYISRDVPFGTYDLAVETEKGFFVYGDQVAVKDTVPQVLSLDLAEDEGGASASKKAAAWWKTPIGIVVISAATVATGLVIGDSLDDSDDTPESPANP